MTHEEIEAYGYGNEIIFKNLEEKIMADIVRRIKVAGELSGSTTYLMEQLLYMGYSNEDIKRLIQEALEESEEYVDELYDKVLEDEYLGSSPIFQAKGKEMIPFKKNPVMQNLLSFAKSSTNGEMVNMTRTLGFVKNTRTGTKAVELSKFYKETMDKALMEVATGTFSLDRALNDAVNTMVNSGVRWIDYESGHHNRIAVAARRAVMTGLAHASQEQTKNMAKELDIHTFEVSAHMGARPSHAQWQGKVYTESELVSVCGLGEVTGLLGANCYHNYYMFFEGVSKRAYTDEQLEQWKDDTPTSYDGKEYTNYEARQRMRQMETNMRAQKEKIKLLKEGGASEDAIKEAQARYRKQMSEYEKFSDAMNLKTQKERITIGDGKTMKGVKTLAKSSESGTIYLDRISMRDTSRGRPNAISYLGVDLNTRQKRILEQLPNYDSRMTFRKKDVSMKDLAALTALTGHEFAMFTKGSERLIVRGTHDHCNITVEQAELLKQQGYKWSGHTHPGISTASLTPSTGDYKVLKAFGQRQSVIYNSVGKRELIYIEGD